jgi:catechol 2,3-dioxygenase-like lactoylglutathione lyase family enzyme
LKRNPLRIEDLTPLLSVFDMKTSIEFYTGTLGFEVVTSAGPSDDPGWALLRSGDVELMLNSAYETPHRPPQPDPAHRAVHADTYLYFACADVDAAYTRLTSLGAAPSPPAVAKYGMKQLFLHDPDGYTIYLQHPVSPD